MNRPSSGSSPEPAGRPTAPRRSRDGERAGRDVPPGETAERPDLRVHLALLAAQAIFALFAVIGKAVLREIDPMAVAGLRVAVSTPLLVLGAAIFDRVRPRLRDLPHLALLGLLGVFTNQVFFILGLERTTATNASILMPSIPVFAAGVAILLGIESFDRRRGLGIFLAVAGALVLLDPTRLAFSDGTAFGNLLILINCLAYGAFLVVQRPLFRRLPPLTVIAGASVFGSFGVLALALPELGRLDLGAQPAWVLWGLLYAAVVPSTVAHAIMTWGVHRSSSAMVATYTTLQPVIATILAAVLLGEMVGWRGVLGFALIVLGLWQVSRRGGRTGSRRSTRGPTVGTAGDSGRADARGR